MSADSSVPFDFASPDLEAVQRRALRRNRLIATALLAFMAVVFVVTARLPEANFWVALVHGTAEAAMVGALADWFAVTAIFRRPLGLPIPHTAIVPRNKDRIAEGLGNFIERHFLTEDLLVARVRSLEVARRLAEWIAAPNHAATVAGWATRLLPYLVRAVDDREIRAFTAQALGDQLRAVELAPLLARIVGTLTAGRHHEALLASLIEAVLEFLDRHGAEFESAVAERRKWWMPKSLDRTIARAMLKAIGEGLSDARRPDSRMRARLLDAIATLPETLAGSPERRMRLEEARTWLLAHPDVQDWLGSLWDKGRDTMLQDFASPASRTCQALTNALGSAGRTLLNDENMRDRVNGFVEAAVVRLLPWRTELTRFVSDVVRRWDQRVLVDRMELTLGADLQYIRITGALVGGSVGCILFLISHALR